MNDDDTRLPPTDPQFDPTRDDYNTNLRIEPALERRYEIGLLTAVFETIQQILFNPAKTAAHLRLNGWLLPTVFLVLVSMVASAGIATIYCAIVFSFMKFISSL